MRSTEDRITAAAADITQAVQEAREAVDVGLAQFHNAVRLQGARYVGVGASAGRFMAWGAPGRLVGWSLRAVGVPTTLVVRDSRTAGIGEIVAEIVLAADTTQTIWLGSGVSFTDGLYLDVVAGVIEGAVYIGVGE